MGVFARIVATVAIVALSCAGPAVSQEPLEVQLPPLQPAGSPLPGTLVPDTSVTIDRALRRLTHARETTVGRLVREHRAELDRDSAGELVVRSEVVAVDITAPALDRALAEKFLVRRTRKLDDLGVVITVLQTPEGWTAKRGLTVLRKLDPAGTYDYNHVYLQSANGDAEPRRAAADAPGTGIGRGRVGLVDGGVDESHQVFRNVRFHRFGCENLQFPGSHGTAVAAILVTQGVTEVFSADVYCGKPAGGAVDGVAAALAWLARERVAVINISLVGPRNALLERVVASLISRGFLLVAAVGNDGPAAPPLYPASYPGVVGVTAVDSNHRVLVEACRGEQVDFAARGSDMQAASQGPDTFVAVRGTSFAAPVIAGILAADLAAPDAAQRDRVMEQWVRAANDLGKKGRDDVYGSGELGDLGSILTGEANK